jgi:hypothetical protein
MTVYQSINLGLFGLSFVLGLFHFFSLKKCFSIDYSVETFGVILSSKFISKYSHIRKVDTFTLDLTYHYFINGVEFRSSKLNFKRSKDIFGSQEYIQNFINKYPATKKVKVYYRQDNHSDAVLEKRVGLVSWFVLTALLVPVFFYSAQNLVVEFGR